MGAHFGLQQQPDRDSRLWECVVLRHPEIACWFGRLGLSALAVGLVGCALQPAQMGLGSSRGSFSDPNKSVFAPAPPSNQVRPGTIVVATGDTLSGLAQRHKVSMFALMHENRLRDPNITPGMVLRLPRT